MATSRILGPDGQPIQMPDLQEPQTSRLLHLQRELQTHPTRGLTPSRLAKILDAAETGDLIAQFELFEDMEEKDGHIAAEMGKRRRACVLDWDVVPPEGADAAEKKTAAQLGELLMEIPDFEDMVFDLTDAIGKGYACLEIEWHQVEGYWVPKTITHRPQSWFTLHRGYRQELRLRSNAVVDGVMGDPLRPFGWITHIHKAKSGYLERAALFRQLVWTYLFKNYSVGDLAEFLELIGVLRLGKYPPNASDKEKAALLRALAAIGHNASGIIPEGMLIEFHNVEPGDPKAFQAMIDWCERNQSKVILGGTLTSGADGKASTNALGNVHNEVRKDLRDGDIRQANTTLTRDLVFAVASLNGLAPGGLRRLPQFRLKTQEREDLTAFSQGLPPLVNMGVRPPVSWVHERLGIPTAQGNEPVLMPVQQATPVALPSALAATTAQLPAPAAPAIAPPHVQMQPRLADNMASAVGGWFDLVRDLVMRAQSLAEIRDGLDALLPGMTLDQYAAAMAVALRAAEMAGRYEVMQEAAGG
ncbi:DUF935 domain-containing protein [Alicycliphilus denitrificans]|uniref:DUF935 domain-containing protein n=1 Tax=Alicycliphilus denitrificans TaxID=179636 RepID=UPI0001D9F28F|nr:DUF935 domain-containing protein [Alicycliphilus denitrificans]ADU99821.1 protein of unknown function DUF935 [Alicycliphilus denitrificans BC]